MPPCLQGLGAAMLLCLDVGNTHIFGGVVDQSKILLRFRYATNQVGSSDQIGTFLKAVLRENSIAADAIQAIAICSVVPSVDYSLKSACLKYFALTPFELKSGVKTGLKLAISNPNELGADLVASAVGALAHYPGENIIIIDFGTVTTLCAIRHDKTYCGASFLPGMQLSMNALHHNASKLSAVVIVKPAAAVGKKTETAMQSGLYYGHVGALKELITRFTLEQFPKKPPLVIGTGGFSHLFESENLFHHAMGDLVLQGLAHAWRINSSAAAKT